MFKRKTDGSALYYLSNNNDPIIFTIKVELLRDVKLDHLESAVATGLERHPGFKVKIKKGFSSYFYMENDKLFRIQKRNSILNKIDYQANHGYLFNVSYQDNDIFFDFFHALTDGTGAIQFVSTILRNYRNAAQSTPTEMFDIKQEELENAYAKYSHETQFLRNSTDKRENFSFMANSDFSVLKYRYPVKEIISAAKVHDCTVTEFILAAFIFAIIKTRQQDLQEKQISIAIPIDLRRFYPSQTLYNFASSFHCEIKEPEKIDNLENCIDLTKNQFQEKTKREHISGITKYANSLEEFPVKFLPLFLKHALIRTANNRRITSNFSNLGIIDRKNEFVDTVKQIGFFLPCGENLPVCITASSYNNVLTLNFSTVYKDEEFFGVINDILLGRS